MAKGVGIRGPLRVRSLLMLAGSLPVSTAAVAQSGGAPVNDFAIAPRVNLNYDSNVVQLNDSRFSGDKSDTIVSPALDLSFDRTIGRNNVSVQADLAYDFHRRFRSLDQVDISGSGHGTLAFSAYCTASPDATLLVQQNNPSGAEALKNSQTLQDYSATVACRRPFGFFPSVTASYQSTANSQELLGQLDEHTIAFSGGVGYAVPTIGSLLLSVGSTRIRQPNRAAVDGRENGSDVFNAGLNFDRAVAPRLSFSLAGRYLSVDSLSAATPGYQGAGYNVSVDYHPSPRVSLVGSASRDVTGTGDVSVSYVLASSYGLTGSLNLSPQTSFKLNAQHFDRTYRGENPLFFPVLRGSERGVQLSANISHTVARRIELTTFAAYTSSDAQGTFYDYKRFQLGLSAGARF